MFLQGRLRKIGLPKAAGCGGRNRTLAVRSSRDYYKSRATSDQPRITICDPRTRNHDPRITYRVSRTTIHGPLAEKRRSYRDAGRSDPKEECQIAEVEW